MPRRKLEPGELSRDAAVRAARELCEAQGVAFPGVREVQRWYRRCSVPVTEDIVAAFLRDIAEGVPTPVADDVSGNNVPASVLEEAVPAGVDLADVGTPPVVVLQALGNSPQAFAAFQQGCRIWDERRRAEWQHRVERAEYVHHDAVIECLRTPDQTLAQLEVEATRWKHTPEQVIRLARERVGEALNEIYQREIGSRRRD